MEIGPETALTELIPAFLERVHHDVMDGQPLPYRRLEDGGCLLWSIGRNRTDDGGKRGDARYMTWKAPDWVAALPASGGKTD